MLSVLYPVMTSSIGYRYDGLLHDFCENPFLDSEIEQ